jgi:hypothetical protein
MSPTFFAVPMARVDAEIEVARQTGDLDSLQRLLAEATSLVRAMYGRPA